MNDLVDIDAIARTAVAELKATAAHVARTEEGLAALRPAATARRRPMILSLAAATVLLGAGVWYATRSTHERTIGPATTLPQVDTTTVPTTATTTTPTTIAPTTTVGALPVSAIVLRPDGIGDARFGMSFDQAMTILRTAFGAPSVDISWTNQVTAPTPRTALAGSPAFPMDTFWDEWVYPASRQLCWDSAPSLGFCVSFGGSTLTSVTMVGWSYIQGGTGSPLHLTDANGLTLGTSWRDARPYLSSPTNGCYISAEAATGAGILVELSAPPAPSAGFGNSCDPTSPVPSTDLPDPSTVTISGMRAGRTAGSPPGD